MTHPNRENLDATAPASRWTLFYRGVAACFGFEPSSLSQVEAALRAGEIPGMSSDPDADLTGYLIDRDTFAVRPAVAFATAPVRTVL